MLQTRQSWIFIYTSLVENVKFYLECLTYAHSFNYSIKNVIRPILHYYIYILNVSVSEHMIFCSHSGLFFSVSFISKNKFLLCTFYCLDYIVLLLFTQKLSLYIKFLILSLLHVYNIHLRLTVLVKQEEYLFYFLLNSIRISLGFCNFQISFNTIWSIR